MPEPTPSDDRLKQLEERWRADRSSRMFVQLAEEYRRRKRNQDALQVLQEGLAAHPTYLSAQVALGRVRLELGDAAGARDVFARVLEQDPTHLIAGRELVESHLELGAVDAAQDALARYRLLGAPDGEVEELEAGLQRLLARAPAARPAAVHELEPTTALPELEAMTAEPAPAAAEAGVANADAAPGAGAGEAGATPPGGEVFHLAPPRLTTLSLPRRPGSTRERQLQVSARALTLAPPVVAAGPSASDVFALWSQGGAATAPLLDDDEAPGAAGAEAAIEAVPVSAEAAAGREVDEIATALEPEPVEEAAAESAAGGDPGDETGAEVIPVAVPQAAPAPPAEASLSLETSLEPALEPGLESVPEPEETPEGGAEPELVGTAAAEAQLEPMPAPEPDTPASGPSSGPSSSPEPSPVPAAATAGVYQPAATVTLGELYLRQGHLEDAASIFRQVLAREPANAAAIAGLDAVRQQPGAPVDASRLLADDAPRTAGITARKILVLRRYLAVFRGKSLRDVPGTPEGDH